MGNGPACREFDRCHWRAVLGLADAPISGTAPRTAETGRRRGHAEALIDPERDGMDHPVPLRANAANAVDGDQGFCGVSGGWVDELGMGGPGEGAGITLGEDRSRLARRLDGVTRERSRDHPRPPGGGDPRAGGRPRTARARISELADTVGADSRARSPGTGGSRGTGTGSTTTTPSCGPLVLPGRGGHSMGGRHWQSASPHGGVRPQRRAQVPDADGTIVERGRTGGGMGGDGRSMGRSVRTLARVDSAEVMRAKGSGPVDVRGCDGRGSGRGRDSGAGTEGGRAGVVWRTGAPTRPAALRTASGTYTRESHRPDRACTSPTNSALPALSARASRLTTPVEPVTRSFFL